MQKPSERHKLTSDNNIIKFKKPVHDPFKTVNTLLESIMYTKILKLFKMYVIMHYISLHKSSYKSLRLYLKSVMCFNALYFLKV